MQLIPFDRCENLALDAEVERVAGALEFIYAIHGDTGDVIFPAAAAPERTDGLWQATCFEAFVSVGKSSYVELNFAPSGRWAAYRFTNYRQGMRDLDVKPPRIRFADNRLVATIELDAPAGAAMNLAAVIEHRSGARSYWALAHPKSNRPDFHTRDCFVAKLP